MRVSGGGSVLAFESTRGLVKWFDNAPVEPGLCGEGGGGCREVYLYDAVSGRLVCVSCDSGGGSPVGPAELGAQEEDTEGNAFGEVSSFYVQRNLSVGGGRLFFQSGDALVPSDSDGLVNVYEWERPASGVEPGDSCSVSSADYSAHTGGCVFAVSDVAGGYASHFMDASPSGEDVFIATADQLVPSDTDSRVDVYDVRVGGGFPVVAVPAVCVNADSCKGPVSGQPGVFGVPASATFSGPGNPVPVKPVVKPKAKPKRKVETEG